MEQFAQVGTGHGVAVGIAPQAGLARALDVGLEGEAGRGEHVVGDAAASQHFGESFGCFDGGGADAHRLADFVEMLDFADDLGQRLLAIAQIVAVAFMAASISGDTADSTFAFALAYLAARTILVIMYVRARRHVHETRELVTGYIYGHSVAIGIWALSLAAPADVRPFLWAIGLAIDFYTPFHLRKIQAKVPPEERTPYVIVASCIIDTTSIPT